MSISLKSYEKIAKLYSKIVDSKEHNAYNERPAMIQLIGNVKDANILDVGCGNGFYSEYLLSKGAKVVALDYSTSMIKIAKKRINEKISIIRADINKPLTFLKNNSFDAIVCPLVLHYVKNWDKLFVQFNKKLIPNGKLIFSINHPLLDYLNNKNNKYFEIELVREYWPTFKTDFSVYRRPLFSIFNTLLNHGFSINRVVEPMPIKKLKKINKEKFELFSKRPQFLCIRAKKLKIN